MLDKQSFSLSKVIKGSFYTLFFLTPLFWTPLNYELFEYNKMTLVYFLTILIVGCWILKIINQKSLIINRTPLDIPLLLFLGANILSTIFSIDTHTSIHGYYSRLNGGLLSMISYTLLYFAATSNFKSQEVRKLLKATLFGGLLVALWAIPEHFGVSPSCIILRGELSASCWVQDVQARVFATLGQPNWLASFISMLIFPTLYFLFTSSQKIPYYLLLTTLYLALTFTYSRSGMVGFLVGLAVFGAGILGYKDIKKLLPYRNILISIIAIFIFINLIFGSALTRFQLSDLLPRSSDAPTHRSEAPTTLTQLEAGGTESWQIRLVVWQGALEIFKHYPIFGSGVETFAYSYYQFRPVAHNLVSEWDFLYNKAHNEFLNYLANTGMIGFGTYMLLIMTFIVWSIKSILRYKDTTIKDKAIQYPNILISSSLASYIAYHVQNFGGFSVVITALFFFLFPAFTFIATDSTKPFKWPKSLTTIFYRRPIYTKATRILVLLVTSYLLLVTIRIWYADTLFETGQKALEAGNAGRAYNYLSSALDLNKSEPFYRSELGYAAGAAALALADSNATLSAELKDQSVRETEKALKTSPNNISLMRTAIRTYYQLVGLDDTFNQKTLETLDKTISLAPTDPKLYYNKAIILGQIDENREAIEALNKAIQLKSNYREAYFALSLFLFDEGDTKGAVENMNNVLVLVPGDRDALDQLNEWGREGIATRSAEP